jgi:hypothetical protein
VKIEHRKSKEEEKKKGKKGRKEGEGGRIAYVRRGSCGC